MNNKMLETVLKFQEKCCTDFQATDEMLPLFKSNMYDPKPSEESMDASASAGETEAEPSDADRNEPSTTLQDRGSV
ncbi:hypothetical protein PoB_001632500 [Plakobranchus ocellatus]|uniref:Uncharacterized protein n=1 Tax=Plakobranchus ocellatus TaxID=259542 RepID=A0AAV3Z3U1_9GAST|nr:hypothetical protein PoB_001632500 [Plakobranchus ocellatus]